MKASVNFMRRYIIRCYKLAVEHEVVDICEKNDSCGYSLQSKLVA